MSDNSTARSIPSLVKMVRELRQRKSRPNYAALMQGEEENEAGPSKPRQKSKVIEIGSDFEPEKDVEADEDVHMSPGRSSEDHDEAHAIPTRQGKKTTKKRGKSVPSTPGPRQVVSHAGTLPNVHHRHRALPIYNREGKVERFKTRPRLFKPGDIIQTNGWAENNVIADRVGKAWGYNVGPGPLWEMLEDRGWYKEAMSCGDDVEEMLRRPRTHQTVRVQENWCILNEQ